METSKVPDIVPVTGSPDTSLEASMMPIAWSLVISVGIYNGLGT